MILIMPKYEKISAALHDLINNMRGESLPSHETIIVPRCGVGGPGN